MEALYRTILVLLLSTHTVIGAPQEPKESSITYLKIQSPTTEKPVETQNYRSYGFVPSKSKKSSKNRSNPVVTDNHTDPDNSPEPNVDISKSDFHENYPTEVPYDVNTGVPEHSGDNEAVSDTNLSNQNVSKTNQTDEVLKEEISEKIKINANVEEKGQNLLKDTFENLENDPSESSQFDRHSRDYDYTTTTYDSSETELADYSTEKYEKDTKIVKKVSPKLTYFQKYGGSFSHNLIESSGKRRFRSRCRCEKIWNCPKLQITVPRCPEEYFMCCF